jgi:predicted acetyltransferase
MLHPFRHGFYARRGYADVKPNVRLACDPRAIPKAWVEAARAAKLGTSHDTKAIIAIYDAVAKRSAGWLRRPKTLWARRFASERRHYVVFARSKSNRGYIAFETTQREPHAETRLLVHELVARDDEARRVLWGFLGMQAGQVAEIDVELAQDDPTPLALTDIDGARFGIEDVEHTMGELVAGPMIKLLDRKRALSARSVASKSLDGVTIDDRTLASVAFGGFSLAGAVALDLARGSERAIKRAAAALRIPPFFTIDRF